MNTHSNTSVSNTRFRWLIIRSTSMKKLTDLPRELQFSWTQNLMIPAKKWQALSRSLEFHFSLHVSSLLFHNIVLRIHSDSLSGSVMPLLRDKWFGRENTRHLWQNCRWNQNPSSLCVANKIIIIQLDLKLDLHVEFKNTKAEQESLMQ